MIRSIPDLAGAVTMEADIMEETITVRFITDRVSMEEDLVG